MVPCVDIVDHPIDQHMGDVHPPRSKLSSQRLLKISIFVKDVGKNLARFSLVQTQGLNLVPMISTPLKYNILLILAGYTGWFLRWASPKNLKYGKPRLGESTLT